MTLRLSGRSELPPLAPSSSAKSGTEYLEHRLAAHRRAKHIPELVPLLPIIERWVVAERTERHETPPWFASAYHLIAREQLELYHQAVSGRIELFRERGIRLDVSGPWAPYAFGPGAEP